MLSSLKRLTVMAFLLAAPACGTYETTTATIAYAPIDAMDPAPTRGAWPVQCSFANRTQGACIGSCLQGDATSCNDAGRLLELHATSANGLTDAHDCFERACAMGYPRACKNAVRVAKRRAAAMRTVAPAAEGDGVSL